MMYQGYISDVEWHKLTATEKASLATIRSHFETSSCVDSNVDVLKLVDQSFEAMGKRYRDRINNKIASYGRYSNGNYDGVFLIIQGAIRDYQAANQFFPPRVSEAKVIYQSFMSEREKIAKNSTKSIEDLEKTIEWLMHRSILRCQTEPLEKATLALTSISKVLDEQLRSKESLTRPQSSVENFVSGVCGFLVWFGDIKPTRPINPSGSKTPLLRFLDVFYPSEAEAALSSLYEKQKRALPSEKIGSGFFANKIGGKRTIFLTVICPLFIKDIKAKLYINHN